MSYNYNNNNLHLYMALHAKWCLRAPYSEQWKGGGLVGGCCKRSQRGRFSGGTWKGKERGLGRGIEGKCSRVWGWSGYNHNLWWWGRGCKEEQKAAASRGADLDGGLGNEKVGKLERCWDLNMSMRFLKSICSMMGSQWIPARTGVMWVQSLVQISMWAAEFWISWIFWTMDLGRPARSTLK